MTDELDVRALSNGMPAQWNQRNAQGMAAMFHGRPELSRALTEELRQLL
jgi:hypothetical protein